MHTIETAQAVQRLTEALIKRPSVTPEDEGCQTMLAERLASCGFTIEWFNAGGVTNLWATREFSSGPHLVLAGHTDVVPTGPLEAWASDPFVPTTRDGYLYGRGAADMKASLAAMIVATEAWLESTADMHGRLSFLITSDEEGPATHGTRYVVDALIARGEKPDFCLVGEPSSSRQLGDVVRCGRRGSLNATIDIAGVQGHVAYPDIAENPIHTIAPAIAELTQHQWDQGNAYYPPSSFQISNIQSGTGATNVIPGELRLLCNFRFNTEQTAEGLQAMVENALSRHGVKFSAEWKLSGLPFLTEDGALTRAVTEAIETACGITTELSTSGGTSDGRFIAPWDGQHQVQVVELGPINATIHKIDECVALADLAPLADAYQGVISRLLVNAS